MADGVSITRLGRWLRRPWYALWNTLRSRAYAGREYVLAVPQGQRIYAPWYAPPSNGGFARVLAAVTAHGPMSASPDRCYVLHHYAGEAARKHPGAAMAECGVYTGGTAEIIASAAPAATLHLFDSFAGMPEESTPARDYHAPGDFSDTSVGQVQRRLDGRECVFHVGYLPATFAEVAEVRGYAFVHVDVDIYTSVRDCIAWFWPRLAPGGVMIFDDYGFFPYRLAARRAVDEYFSGRPENVLALPTGQGVAVKDG